MKTCPRCGNSATNYIREDVWGTGHPEFGCPNCGMIFHVPRSVLNATRAREDETARLRRENESLRRQLKEKNQI